jgi:hypothetical protein
MSGAMHTPGPWREGTGGSVVSDHPVPEVGGSDDVAYYGGHLIAESIAPQNRPLIAAAADLFSAAQAVDADIEAQGVVKAESIEKLRLALAKAGRK